MIEQEWAKDNIDLIMKWWIRLNKSQQTSNRSKDKKNMLVDMDTPRYRAYYYLAKNDEKKKLEKAKTIGDRVKYNEDQLQRTMNDENMKRCINILEDQLIAKDKQIAFLEKLIESGVSAKHTNQI